MDVRCERCNTEYEFDDALVSGRGTTVKCTSCGHKFKIRRRDGDFSEDFWNVQTGEGRTLVFTSLRELQRAIQTHLVDRGDMLSRGGLPPKAIGQIPELAPFFEQREERERAKSLPPARAAVEGSSTMRTSRPPPPPGAPAQPLAAPPRQRMATRPEFPAPPAVHGESHGPNPVEISMPPAAVEPTPAHGAADRAALPSFKKTLAGHGNADDATSVAAAAAAAIAGAAERSRVASVPPVTEREPEPDTERFDREAHRAEAVAPAAPVPRVTERIAVPRGTPPPPAFEASSPLPPPTAPVRRMIEDVTDDYESGARAPSPSLHDGPSSMGRRRSVGGYVVALIVFAAVAGVGAIWARDHLGSLLGRTKPAASAAIDPRVAGLLAAGEKALADGNLDAAKESFDKASALAEKDPHVLLDVARLAAIRADGAWLKSRLLAADAVDEQRITKDTLVELSAAARRAADEALTVGPDDPAALRAKIDALRISGDREGARALVARLSTSASQPETAYVLAALDLAEKEPLWSTVVERLRGAASAESGPGRARASLAYALARSGDVAGAKAEVERLASMSRQHPLLPLLRAFADHATPAPVAAADAGPPGPVASSDPKDPKDPKKRGDKGEAAHGASGGGGAPSGDPRVLVAQAEKARARGDYDKALGLYNAALERNPGDTEALSGLGAIAYARRDLNGARQSYKRVLSINPSYVPALVGVGDVDWDSGDRASAMKQYKEIVDRFPEGTYPARVKQRLESAGGGGGAPGGSAPPPPSNDPGGGGGGG